MDRPYVCQVFHGPPCPEAKRCPGTPGELLIEVTNATLGGMQAEAAASRARVLNPADHAARFTAWGPDGYRDQEPPPDA